MPLKRPPSIRHQLACLVLVAVLPVWLVAGALVIYSYAVKCDQVKRNLLETAHSLTMVVDRELSGVQAALQALATSPTFASGDFAGVHRQALQLLKAYPGADIIVADATGQQVVNSARPFGSPLPRRNNPETVRRIFAVGNPVISDLFYGALSRKPLISIDIPVVCDGRVAYDLAMTFPSSRIAAVLPQQQFPPGWYGTIMDSTSVVIARSRHAERYVGKRVSSALARAIGRSPQGILDATNVEGERVFASFDRSAMSAWGVVVGVPKSAVMSGIYQWMAWAVAGSSLLSLIGIAVALVIGRRIVRAEEALSLLNEELEARVARRTAELRERDQVMLLQSRQAAMGEMIGNIAHQWRQPLNNLGLAIQQVAIFYGTEGFTKDFLNQSVRKSMDIIKHMSKTIDDFGNYFKPDKEKASFEVSGEIEKTLSLIGDRLKYNHIEVEIRAQGDSVINGYPNEFDQVLLNILNNASEALIERGVANPKVMITFGHENGRSFITVADNAGGIPDEVLNKVFDPYFSTKGPQQGTGIGLYMSKSIIEKNMGGRLAVRNVREGAEFRIEV